MHQSQFTSNDEELGPVLSWELWEFVCFLIVTVVEDELGTVLSMKVGELACLLLAMVVEEEEDDFNIFN